MEEKKESMLMFIGRIIKLEFQFFWGKSFRGKLLAIRTPFIVAYDLLKASYKVLILGK
jgi:hypothetical protein